MKIVYRRRALADLEKIHDYIATENVIAARSVVNRIREALDLLADFPYSGRLGSKAGTRELVVARLPYIAVYRLPRSGKSGALEILAVYHAAQNRLAH